MSAVSSLASVVLGAAKSAQMAAQLAPMTEGQSNSPDHITRAQFATALNLILFADLVARVPEGAEYVGDVVAGGGRITFDHGALRTIRMPSGDTGALPAGEGAFRRILEPLGYRVAATYPLPRLRMTGHAFCHLDYPETLPQFFVSELHVDQFDAPFAAACARIFGTSRDPLNTVARAVLDQFAAGEAVSLAEAQAAIPAIAAAFGCHHATPALADYTLLKSSSAEAAWIATEGNAFNHVTDRVGDVTAVAAAQRALGRAIKDRVEVSASGHVRQTAFRAATVTRAFVAAHGETVQLPVPGSFFEFITRDRDAETGALDLSFDSGNATGIFAMTRTA